MSEEKNMNRRKFLKTMATGALAASGIAAFASPGVQRLANAMSDRMTVAGGCDPSMPYVCGYEHSCVSDYCRGGLCPSEYDGCSNNLCSGEYCGVYDCPNPPPEAYVCREGDSVFGCPSDYCHDYVVVS